MNCESRFDAADWLCPDCGEEPPFNGYRRLAPPLDELVDAYESAAFERFWAGVRSSFWATGRNRLICWALDRYFPGARNFLEVGCGSGVVLEALRASFPDLTLVGADAHPLALDLARVHAGGAELLLLDGRLLPFADEFDVIGSFDVLELIAEDEQALGQMFKAVRPGGGLLITVPQYPRLWSAADEWALHKRRYTEHDLCRKVRRAGFDVLRVTSFVTILLPLMIASRARQRRRTAYDPCDELRLPRGVQTAFGATLELELRLIRHGVDLPWGGSLLLVARKARGGTP